MYPFSRSERLEHAFECVLEGIRKFGQALDALDRGFSNVTLEKEGHELIGAAFKQAPELKDFLPKLALSLNAGKSVADDGYQIRDEINAAREILRKQIANCVCLSITCQPYPWSYDDFDSVAERADEPRITTIRCKQCSRFFDVTTDYTPATHSISSFSTAIAPPATSERIKLLKWLGKQPPEVSQAVCDCQQVAARQENPIFTEGLSTDILASRLIPPINGQPTPEKCWTIQCNTCHRWWDVRIEMIQGEAKKEISVWTLVEVA